MSCSTYSEKLAREHHVNSKSNFYKCCDYISQFVITFLIKMQIIMVFLCFLRNVSLVPNSVQFSFVLILISRTLLKDIEQILFVSFEVNCPTHSLRTC